MEDISLLQFVPKLLIASRKSQGPSKIVLDPLNEVSKPTIF